MVSDEQARAAAREILAEGRFTRWDAEFDAWLNAFSVLAEMIPKPLIEFLVWLEDLLIERILGGFFSALRRFLEFFGVLGVSNSAIGWLVVALFLTLAILLAYRIWGSNFFEPETDAEDGAARGNHRDSISEAKAIAGEGRFLEAAHRVQLATLALLIEKDWLELARSDPNRTLRERVAGSALPERERTTLIDLVDRLEALWFDEPREDRALFEEWLALDARLFRVAGRSAA